MPTDPSTRIQSTTVSRFTKLLREFPKGEFVDLEEIERNTLTVEAVKEEGFTFTIEGQHIHPVHGTGFSPEEFKAFLQLCCQAYSDTTGDLVILADPDDL